MKHYKVYALGILKEIEYLDKNVRGLEYNDFNNNETIKRASVRSLEIIGEAIKRFPKDIIVQYPDVDWRGFARGRDLLIHQYSSVSYKLVWKIIENDIPELNKSIESILKENKLD